MKKLRNYIIDTYYKNYSFDITIPCNASKKEYEKLLLEEGYVPLESKTNQITLLI